MQETNVPATGIGIIENGKLKYIVLFPQSRRGLIVFTNSDGTEVWTSIVAEAFDVGKEMLGRAVRSVK